MLVALLRKVEWPVSRDVFDGLLGAVPTVAIEVVILSPDKKRVVLIPREMDDPFFAGKVHSPGTIMRRGDTEATALDRAMREISAEAAPPEFVGRFHVPMGSGPMDCSRGQEIGLLFVTCLRDEPFGQITADVDDLPSNLVGFHGPMIRKAVEFAKKRN